MPAHTRLPLSDVFKNEVSFEHVEAICPHCGNHVGFAAMSSHSLDGAPRVRHGYRFAHVGYCRTCAEIVIGAAMELDGGRRIGYLLWPTTVWPDNAPEGLEPQIKTAYDEARKILELSPQGAAVLARRCLQHVIRERLGITKRTLFKEIEEAKKRDELSRPTRDAVDHVRQIGIWGAHPIAEDEPSEADEASTIIEVTKEQAEYTLQTLEMLFDDLYVKPTKIARMMTTIADKKPG